jgi:hypothetical protein
VCSRLVIQKPRSPTHRVRGSGQSVVLNVYLLLALPLGRIRRTVHSPRSSSDRSFPSAWTHRGTARQNPDPGKYQGYSNLRPLLRTGPCTLHSASVNPHKTLHSALLVHSVIMRCPVRSTARRLEWPLHLLGSGSYRDVLRCVRISVGRAFRQLARDVDTARRIRPEGSANIKGALSTTDHRLSRAAHAERGFLLTGREHELQSSDCSLAKCHQAAEGFVGKFPNNARGCVQCNNKTTLRNAQQVLIRCSYSA